MKQAIGYIRVSTAEQANEGVSLEAQRSRIAAWAEVNDYSLAAIHSDAGLSGKRADNRPELQRALDAACGRRDKGDYTRRGFRGLRGRLRAIPDCR